MAMESPVSNYGPSVQEQLGIQPIKRPTNIEKDVNSLGQTKRVSNVLTSPAFKEELETVVTDLLRSGHGGGHVIAKEIANFFSPNNRSFQQGGTMLGMKAGIGCVSPINDISLADSSLYTKGERVLRCKLAALYRIVDLYGWSNTIFNHITVRVSQEHEHFLINPFGLLYHEVSASKLLKINMQGEVLDAGSTTLGYNAAGYTLHSAIHSARPDLHCVIHVHTSDVLAVSSMECGLLPISQESMLVGEVSYHNYHGILVDQKEKKAIQKNLGPNNKVMILRNHGLVACGETVEEAFHYLYFTMLACSAQVKAMSCMPHKQLIRLDRSALKSRTEDVGKKDVTAGKDTGIQWGVGEMLFESLVRMLDDMGYRSGYTYKNPVVFQRKPRMRSDVEVPAYVFNPGSPLPEEIAEARGSLRRIDGHSHWVNSPNTYTRVVESQEEGVGGVGSSASSQNGDVSPRTKTKWKRSDDTRPSSSNAVHITNPNQFVPTNTDPREVLQTRKSIRGQGRRDMNRPGPQSQLLHGVSPDRSAPGDRVSTASKGIIEKGHDVHVVSHQGPPNPFNAVSENELKEYQKTVLSDGDKTSSEAEIAQSPEPPASQSPSHDAAPNAPEPQAKPDVTYDSPARGSSGAEANAPDSASSDNAQEFSADETQSPAHQVTSTEEEEEQSAPVSPAPTQESEAAVALPAGAKEKTQKSERAQKPQAEGKKTEEVVLRTNGGSPETKHGGGDKKDKKKRRSLSFLKKKKQKEHREQKE